MTESERQALQDARSACLASAEAIAAILTDATVTATQPKMVPLKTAAARWGITHDAALKRARRGMATRVGGRWWVPETYCPVLG